jgi:tRNA A-37 threonylcarbamoyl transferase component Bud32
MDKKSPKASVSPAAKLVEIDRICRQFEAAYQAGQQPRVDGFLGALREPERSELRRELEAIAAKHGAAAKGGVSAEVFLQRLSECGVMTASEVQACRAAVPEGQRPATGEQWARELCRQGKLTKFQAQAVYQGKTRGLVVGNYVLLEPIGKGGMGQVYKAQHKKMKRVVALKVLPSAATKSREAVRRFQREVEAAAKLAHPNIVTAYDAAEEHGVHFLVMEYVEGQDLASRVKEQGPLPVAEAMDCVLQAAQGLDYAHRQGVIHRDIKPGNLLRDTRGTVKVLDLGLARVADPLGSTEPTADPALTQSGQLMGTLDYLSPEQALDARQADARADIYSLGCTLYYLLTGRGPYGGETLTQKLLAHREQPIPSLRAVRGDVSETLDVFFQRLVAKRPEDRLQTMGQVVAELQQVLAAGTSPATVGAGRPSPAPPETVNVRPGGVADTAAGLAGGVDLGTAVLGEPILTLERYRPPPPRPLLKRWWSRIRRVLRQKKVAPEGSPPSFRPRSIAIAAVGSLVLASLVYLLFSLLWGVGNGTLVVEVEKPDMLVQVLDKQGVMVTERRADQGPLTLALKAGTYRVRLEDEGVEILAKEVTIASGATQTVSVEADTPRAETPPASGPAPTAEWAQLFDGPGLSGWTPIGQPTWVVRNGALAADGKDVGWLASARDYTDFEFDFEYRLPPGGNSGVFVHAWPEGPSSGGRFVEIQLLGDESPQVANLGADKKTGAIYGIVAPQSAPRTPAGQWHRMTVRSVGRRVDVTVNGARILDANLDDCMAKSPQHEGLKRTSGRIGLQSLRSVVEFRNVRVRELPSGQPSDSSAPASGLVASGNLVGSTWRMTDSDGDRSTWIFQANGVVHYQAKRGLRTNGTWKKSGNSVTIETNNGYAKLEGTISGNAISGKGSSRNGSSWTWRAPLQ